MFSYEFYKVTHLFCIILFAGLIGFSFATNAPSKGTKILTGVISLLILVAGMGLLARIGGGWPGWVIAKLILWLTLAIATPILSKRLQGDQRRKAFMGLMAVFAILIYLGTYRPWS